MINKFNLKKNKFVASYPIRTEYNVIASESIKIGNLLVLTEKSVIFIDKEKKPASINIE